MLRKDWRTDRLTKCTPIIPSPLRGGRLTTRYLNDDLWDMVRSHPMSPTDWPMEGKPIKYSNPTSNILYTSVDIYKPMRHHTYLLDPADDCEEMLTTTRILCMDFSDLDFNFSRHPWRTRCLSWNREMVKMISRASVVDTSSSIARLLDSPPHR